MYNIIMFIPFYFNFLFLLNAVCNHLLPYLKIYIHFLVVVMLHVFTNMHRVICSILLNDKQQAALSFITSWMSYVCMIHVYNRLNNMNYCDVLHVEKKVLKVKKNETKTYIKHNVFFHFLNFCSIFLTKLLVRIHSDWIAGGPTQSRKMIMAAHIG